MNIPPRIEGESAHAYAAFKAWCQDEDRGTPTGLAAGYARRFNWAERLRSALVEADEAANADESTTEALATLTRREIKKLLRRSEGDFAVLSPAQLTRLVEFLSVEPPKSEPPIRDLSVLTEAELDIVRQAEAIMSQIDRRVQSPRHVERLSEAQIEGILRNADLSETSYLKEKNRLRQISSAPWGNE